MAAQVDSDDSEEVAEGEDDPLVIDDVLQQAFAAVSAAECVASINAGAVAKDFIVFARGSHSTEVTSGDYYDYARARTTSKEVDAWATEHFGQTSKSYKISAYGIDGSGKLAKEWARKVQLFLNMW